MLRRLEIRSSNIARLKYEGMPILQKYLDALVGSSLRNRSPAHKITATIIGGSLFLVAISLLLFLASDALDRLMPPDGWKSCELIASIAAIVLGIFYVAWSTMTLATIGRGTPVPIVPTQKLIVSGPYKFCRNPIQLGAMLYYFGLGTLFGSIKIGLLMLLFGFVIGTCYHKFVEEKELRFRFGLEYEEYKARTPFLLPRM